jgi:hypothetical protein
MVWIPPLNGAATADDRHLVIADDFNEWSQTKGFEPLMRHCQFVRLAC